MKKGVDRCKYVIVYVIDVLIMLIAHIAEKIVIYRASIVKNVFIMNLIKIEN